MALDRELRDEIDTYLQKRDEQFSALQENIIAKNVGSQIKEIELERKNRLGVITTVSGFSLFFIGTLLWSTITNVARDTARSQVAEAEKLLQKAREDQETITAIVKENVSLATENVSRSNTALNQTEKTLNEAREIIDRVRVELTEVREARAEIKFTLSMMELQEKFMSMQRKSSDDAGEVEPVAGKLEDGPILNLPLGE